MRGSSAGAVTSITKKGNKKRRSPLCFSHNEIAEGPSPTHSYRVRQKACTVALVGPLSGTRVAAATHGGHAYVGVRVPTCSLRLTLYIAYKLVGERERCIKRRERERVVITRRKSRKLSTRARARAAIACCRPRGRRRRFCRPQRDGGIS